MDMDQRYLLEATGQRNVVDALSYLAEDNQLLPQYDRRRLLRIVATQPEADRDDRWRDALRRLARWVSSSEFDPSAVLFDADSIEPLLGYSRALDALAACSPTGTLVGMTPASVAAAQRSEPRVMEVLCAIAGISTRDLRERAAEVVPGDTRQTWTQQGIERAFAEIDALVQGKRTTTIEGAVPCRALEFVNGFSSGGWASVEGFRTQGTPYALLLMQREVGTAWGAHRNRTARRPTEALAGQLCESLDRLKISYRRGSSAGGKIAPSAIKALVGRPEPGLVVLANRAPVLGVVFSLARDGGTARKNAGRLQMYLRGSTVPLVLVLLGAGWSERNETVELAEAYEGRIYSERDLAALVDDIRQEIAL